MASSNQNGSWTRCGARKYKPDGKNFYKCMKNSNHIAKGDPKHADTKFGQYHWEDENVEGTE